MSCTSARFISPCPICARLVSPQPPRDPPSLPTFLTTFSPQPIPPPEEPSLPNTTPLAKIKAKL